MALALNRIFDEEYQLVNNWKMYFQDNSDATFQITNTNIPFPKLAYETKGYGKKELIGYDPSGEVSITFRADVGFRVFDYFDDWLNDIYDFRNLEYKTLVNETQKYKNAVIEMYSTRSLGLGAGLLNAYNPFRDSRTKQTNKTFLLQDMFPLGFGDISLDDTTGEPLSVQVDFAFQRLSIL